MKTKRTERLRRVLAEQEKEHIVGDGIVLIPFEVEANYAGWRLDLYLCDKLRRLSRTRVQRIIAKDLVASVPLKASSLVYPGLSFALRKKAEPEPPIPPASELREVYADDDILVMDKPAGLPVHPSARYQKHTLTALLEERYQGRAEPAHRLDRETSGLIVCGRTVEASRRLGVAFQQGRVEKEYLALVEGHPQDSFEVDAPISEGTELIRIAVRIDPDGAPSQTRFEVLQRFEHERAPLSLVRCLPRTGRQHQIRIHAHHAGFPLVGDKMYGPDPSYFDRFSRGCLEPAAWERLRLPRHALHASFLQFRHPLSGNVLSFSSPLPSDLQALLPA